MGKSIASGINEFDHDDYFLARNQDGDELIEVAAPAGTDPSAYRILSAGGNQSCSQPASIAVANVTVDVPLSLLGVLDVVGQALRLNDD